MKAKTLRNLLASMLVLGVAGSVIAVGSGTFALFNAITTNNQNVFQSDNLQFSDTAGGTTCTAQSTGPSSVSNTVPGGADCSAIVTLSSLIPGDSRLGTLTFTNNSAGNGAASHLNIHVSGSVNTAAPGSSSLLDQTAPTDVTTGGGLGLFVFECQKPLGTDVSCGTSGAILVPVTGGGSCAVGNPVTGASGLVTTEIINPSTAVNTVNIGTGTQRTCTGGSLVGANGAGVPISVPGYDTATNTNDANGANSVAPGHSVHLGVVMYLPGSAGNSMAQLTSNLNFAWTAVSVLGTSN